MLMCCVCVFSLHQGSPNMILGDEPLISEVVLSHHICHKRLNYSCRFCSQHIFLAWSVGHDQHQPCLKLMLVLITSSRLPWNISQKSRRNKLMTWQSTIEGCALTVSPSFTVGRWSKRWNSLDLYSVVRQCWPQLTSIRWSTRLKAFIDRPGALVNTLQDFIKETLKGMTSQ
jgi:hypothetical protein